jgi:chitinase
MNWRIFFLIFLLNRYAEAKKHYKVVCYFTNWAVQRPGLGSMTPEHIDPCLCTHLIYAFSDMKDFKLFSPEKIDYEDGNKPGFFERFNDLKKKNPKLKTLLAVGGWEMGMSAFSAMVKDDKNIKKFVDSSIDYLRKWKFDGLLFIVKIKFIYIYKFIIKKRS